jgi:hypothetical protein
MTQGFLHMPHRAVRSYRMQWPVLARDVLVTIALTWLVWRCLGDIAQWWVEQLNFWMIKTGMLGGAQITPSSAQSGLSLIPKFDIVTPTFLPTIRIWWITAIVCVVMWAYSMWLKPSRLPLIYFLRLLVLVQASSLVFFYVWPQSLPTTVANFLTDIFRQSAGLMLLVPALLALTLYLFALPWWIKYLATLSALLFMTFFVPLQAATSAWILQVAGILFMPTLYLFFGLLLQIVALMGIYSFALSLLASDETLVQRGILR